jgi:hypothetical protein
MTDLAVAQTTQSPDTALQQVAHSLTDWLGRLRAPGPVNRSACPAAWELTGITRVERYDAAPWLSF